MSMNLYLEGKVDLYQTPTYVTYLCWSAGENGEPDGSMEGVRRRYCLWVVGHIERECNRLNDYDSMLKSAIEHVDSVMSVEIPKFYIM